MAETPSKFDPEIRGLIQELDGGDYSTGSFSDIGIDSLLILKTVFRADKSYLGGYFARVLQANRQLVDNKFILDLGCGCGLLGLICALHGAKSVHFRDLNPEAVRNSQLNAKILGIQNASFSSGSLFESLPNGIKFDVLVFNPPSISGTPETFGEAAFIREDSLLSEFYRKFPEYLKKAGQLMIPGSSRFQSQLSPINAAKENGWNHEIIAQDPEEGGHFRYLLSIKPSMAAES